MIDVTHEDTVVVLRLDRGVTNALNLASVRELAETLHRAEADPQVRAVVLSSAKKVSQTDHESHEYTNCTNAFLGFLNDIRSIRPFVPFAVGSKCR